MATKAQQFRSALRRSKPAKPKSVRRRRDTPVDTAAPGVSATDRKVGKGSTAARNRSLRAARKGGASLEDSATGRPSRRSTRKSADRTKRDNTLRLRAVRNARSPETRARKPRR